MSKRGVHRGSLGVIDDRTPAAYEPINGGPRGRRQ
jgi:hypothetical protein